MKNRFKILFVSLFISLFFIGYWFFQNGLNEKKEIIEEKQVILGEKQEIIESLKEEIALLEIENNNFSKEDLNLKDITKEFNEDYKTREKILEQSNNVKGVYITKLIGNSSSSNSSAQQILSDIEELLEETELNAVVIDVKEVDGFQLSDNLKRLVEELHAKDIWVIARLVSFRDNSLTKTKPNFYIKNQEGGFWQDHKGYYWLDPSSTQVQKYLIDLSYQVIDAGFDEIQYDYIRFPVDDDEIVYPFYKEEKEKTDIIREFCLRLRNNLRDYKSDIILSVDLFGEVALLSSSPTIGQKISSFVDTFDYISFMIYPSHYFGGFSVGADLERNLPLLHFPYESEDIEEIVSNKPYEIVSRSVYSGRDFISSAYSELELQPQCVGKNSVMYCSKARIRPWLQDFNLKADSDREISYDVNKVRAQINAAEDTETSGWLLWNPKNIYTRGALLTE